MCGFAGFLDAGGMSPDGHAILDRMTGRLVHRGPDAAGHFLADGVGLGFRRLSIVDLEGGHQPLYNETGSIVLVCNGEIFNHRELRDELRRSGHTFRTNSDVEVILHLYERDGVECLHALNGQFAFALYDRTARSLFLARDPFGINPLFYTRSGQTLVFGSEIKALLEHPAVPRAVDLTGLDQILSFPGLVSPRTVFREVSSLSGGHYLLARDGGICVRCWWDLDYPKEGEIADDRPEEEYVEALREALTEAVRTRLEADVPVGLYLSGGLDSSLIAAMAARLSPEPRHSFSIEFTDAAICEAPYQRAMSAHAKTLHHVCRFDWTEIASRLRQVIYHCECPVKETFDTCALALSAAAREQGIKVVLAGDGSDELFAGYVGYRFDEAGQRGVAVSGLEQELEREVRGRLWGDPDLFYEIDQYAFREIKAALYSDALNELLPTFDCTAAPIVDVRRLRGRHALHQRSYLDVKLRLAEHLLSEHGDRMTLANAVEARYPFLDRRVIDVARRTPPRLKLNGLVEKYIVKRVADGLVPAEIVAREKFGFRAPGSPYLLKRKIDWIEDLLSADRIRREGYFNPHAVDRLKQIYSQDGYQVNVPYETDLLMFVITVGILLETFQLPRLS